jgi:SAM-dependent methyltransferase
MPVEVLRSQAEVQRSRERMVTRGLSSVGIELTRSLWERVRRIPVVKIGDELKSWDVLRTIEYIESAHPKAASVLDLGAFSSEVLCALHRAGYTSLTGIDLNPRVHRMPYADRIRWEVGNFLHTPFSDASFDVITSISVIEHGFDALALLREMSRLLRPGGSFVASFDYWPEKIDTADTKFFGLDWLIFSRAEVESFVEQARAFGMQCEGASSFDASERPVSCGGRSYTFAWMALRKK